jgi:23S rRNA (guanosine2251-2'-O)-methyltransferase
MREVILVAHNIRSTHNVGAFFRTCDGLGVKQIIFSGYTPYPKFEGDSRLPHFADKITRQIHKTALGAESNVNFYHGEPETIITNLKSKNTVLVGLEQTPNSLSPKECTEILMTKHPSQPVALFIGNELHGIDKDILSHMNYIMEIPMHGSKESFNVSVATGIALYVLTI